MKARDYRIFIQQANCSMEAKSLWFLIDSFADGDGTNSWPSVKTLMEISGKPKKWIERYIRELKDEGHLSVGKRKQTHKNKFPGNEYRLFARAKNIPTRVGQIRTLYHTHITKTDELSVESEAILHVLPDHLKGDGTKYG